jgi:enamine deaminase RidA (YjgF/YER057c/UK114 family)
MVSPGVYSNGHLFVTGMTGSNADGSMPQSEEAQFHRAFEKIGAVLSAGGLDYGDIVEMTTFHVGLRDHFDAFNRIKGTYLVAPYPAWTAIEVAALRREGAVVEIRVIASESVGSEQNGSSLQPNDRKRGA